MNQKQFRKYVDRDGGCVHCGESLVVSPHHRLNRGMGGSKVRDVPSNIITICSWLNNAMESDPEVAELARELGWKLRIGQDPKTESLYHFARGWLTLDDVFGFQMELDSRVIRQSEGKGI